MNAEQTRRSAIEAIENRTGNRSEKIALIDLNDHQKVGIKGPGVYEWLKTRRIEWPDKIYGVIYDDEGSLLARVGEDEVIIESPSNGKLVAKAEAALQSHPACVYRVEQQASTFLLKGNAAPAVWRQVCGVDIPAELPERILYTRVAGISCGIIPEVIDDNPACRVWVDYSLAPAFFDTLTEIAEEEGLV